MNQTAQRNLENLRNEVIRRDAQKGLDYYRFTYLTRVSKFMRDARRKSGKTQEEVASDMNLEASTISKMENDPTGNRIKVSQFIDYLISCGFLPVTTTIEDKDIRDWHEEEAR